MHFPMRGSSWFSTISWKTNHTVHFKLGVYIYWVIIEMILAQPQHYGGPEMGKSLGSLGSNHFLNISIHFKYGLLIYLVMFQKWFNFEAINERWNWWVPTISLINSFNYLSYPTQKFHPRWGRAFSVALLIMKPIEVGSHLIGFFTTWPRRELPFCDP